MFVDLITVLKNFLSVFNVSVRRVAPPYEDLSDFDYGLRKAMNPNYDYQKFAEDSRKDILPESLLIVEDCFGVCYLMFLVPSEKEGFYLIGPVRIRKQADDLTCLYPYCNDERVVSVFSGIPEMDEYVLGVTVASFISMLYPDQKLKILNHKEYSPLNVEPDEQSLSKRRFVQDIPAEMLERRYSAQDGYIDAVQFGNTEEAIRKWLIFSSFDLGERFTGSLRKRKNSLIIVNTQLRLAIQRANVHPYYINEVSEKYSLKIEALNSEAECHLLPFNMLKDYCEYVNRYAMKQYSPLIQKVIDHIILNLDTQLSLKQFSDTFSISSSYLSNLFKQETGQTLTDYITSQRVMRAAKRLKSSNNSIASIAESVGILDTNYFTKVFKKTLGITPSQYRKDSWIKL